MAAARKRPRDNIDEASRAECPFSIRHVDPRERELKKKRRRRDDEPDGDNPKIPVQMSPFAPTGKFKTHETMDIHYAVEPSKRWSEMTRYNSFVLNGSKYFSDNYIFVANESTIERQKSAPSGGQAGPRTHSDDDWVARILEIRASDEHHVYARVYWMYWPDELPPNTLDGKKYVSGRQPYHGQNELIASNHMDIINVVSVTQQATVNQVTDENDDQIQSALYWRQALDVRTFELSVVDRVCRCNEPGNPDKVLIGCPNESCKKWLHEECLKHEILMRVWEQLGTDRPHKASGVKTEKEEEEAKRPLSPVEPGSATVATELPIQVKTDGEGDTVKASDTVDVKEEREIAAEGSAQTQNGRASTTQTPTAEPIRKGVSRGRKKPDDMSYKPYEGSFEATFKPDNDMFEIKDLRTGVEGGQKTWLEEVNCLVCGSRIH
ncbi:hypothetical protein M406DRAFT_294033 [Cryphonectria parasitica EP155]|uniref:BAH domain-containing protein n=1 Tax=Cryphonectria parasitica (strain ATCC 38755 / EP155) TaxID=660469 RepID=A0A9P4XWR9_CRYP1|nr:uncharacterized protein M406DRAFT_294033 [Cryphonectria parasitica EP155]KAF3762359.1 hypothetical protein M406DRAFT_294033 [Cryphonectria parasitica EP155]